MLAEARAAPHGKRHSISFDTVWPGYKALFGRPKDQLSAKDTIFCFLINFPESERRSLTQAAKMLLKRAVLNIYLFMSTCA